MHKLVDDVHRATVLNYDSLVLEGDAESFIAGDDAGPEDTILDREKKAYLMDSVHALPERLQRVVIGYFFEERSMQDLADELGVSESRISQLRAEALLLLKDGINSQLEPDAVTQEARPNGRVARRKAAYYSAVAAGSSHRGPCVGADDRDHAGRVAREQPARHGRPRSRVIRVPTWEYLRSDSDRPSRIRSPQLGRGDALSSPGSWAGSSS